MYLLNRVGIVAVVSGTARVWTSVADRASHTTGSANTEHFASSAR